MMNAEILIRFALHSVLLLVLAPILQGVIIRVKSLFAGRRGAPILQPWFDIIRLLRKEYVFSRTTTWIFLMGPVVAMLVPLMAATLMPFGALPSPVSFEGDMILFIYLFALARFFTAAAALDTGSAFEGMGAAREVTFSCLAEPTLLFSLLVLTRLSGETALSGMLGPELASFWGPSGASLGLITVCLMVVILLENSRIPFDDPNTHLELTMVHEVMILDHSGPALGMILYGASLKFMVLGALVMRILVPVSLNHPVLDTCVFVGSMIGLAITVGVVESVMARLRLTRIPQILVGTLMISIFAMVLVFR